MDKNGLIPIAISLVLPADRQFRLRSRRHVVHPSACVDPAMCKEEITPTRLMKQTRYKAPDGGRVRMGTPSTGCVARSQTQDEFHEDAASVRGGGYDCYDRLHAEMSDT